MAAEITPEAIAKAGERFPNLETVVAMRTWPTPTSRDWKDTGQNTNWEKIAAKGKLAGAAKMWPTPSANDNRDRGNLSMPAIQRRERLGKQLMLSMVVSDQSGALNPTWVEWLMGFPLGWTALDASEMPSSRKSSKSSGGR
jgi:DNA (cytosine-5)-methyltransferase 1